MLIKNTTLMQSARESLEGKWGIAIIGFLIYNIIISAASYIALIIGGAMTMGIYSFALNISRGKKVEYNQIFQGFKHFVNCLLAYLLIIVYVFLWSLLLIIPGIIKAHALSMVFFILADNPELNYNDAITESEKIMDGHKWQLFKLNIRFFLWSLVCILTLGIGLLWLIPYTYVTYAKFYDGLTSDTLREIGNPESEE